MAPSTSSVVQDVVSDNPETQPPDYQSVPTTPVQQASAPPAPEVASAAGDAQTSGASPIQHLTPEAPIVTQNEQTLSSPPPMMNEPVQPAPAHEVASAAGDQQDSVTSPAQNMAPTTSSVVQDVQSLSASP